MFGAYFKKIQSQLKSSAAQASLSLPLPCPGCLNLNIRDGLRPKEKHVTSYQIISDAAGSGCRTCKLLKGILGNRTAQGGKDAQHDIELLPSKPGLRSLFKISYLSLGRAGWDIFLPHQHPEDEPCSCQSPWPSLGFSDIALGNTSQHAALRQIRRWLRMCSHDSAQPDSCMRARRQNTHDACNRSTQKQLSPTRILKIEGPKAVRLHILDGPLNSEYACLSYCWRRKVPVKLTKALLNAFEKDIEWDTLPLTFQDALPLCRGLGLEYLWIDALCIIQDDDADWRREASRMASIYSQSFITFAASKSQNACEGLYSATHICQHQQNLSSTILPESVGPSFSSAESLESLRSFHMSTSDGSLHRVILRKGSDHRLERLPLTSRGWAFQERLLSPRVVHFGDEELIWECMGMTSCDCGFAPPPDRALSKAQRMDVAANSCAPLRWYDIVIHYVRLNLTFQDVFPALQGLARRMQEERQSEYFAGLWSDTLLQDLLWRVVSTKGARRTQPYLAPTWSWASMSGDLQWFTSLRHVFDQFQPQAWILSVTTDPVGVDPLGALNGGRLCIQ